MKARLLKAFCRNRGAVYGTTNRCSVSRTVYGTPNAIFGGLIFLILLFSIVCSPPTEPKEKTNVEPNPTNEVILYGKRFDLDLYFRYTTTGEYEVVIPEAQFRVSGRYKEDEYGNMVLDGNGCDGINGVYYIRPVLGVYYSTSADYCPRHFWLTGTFTRVNEMPQITQKREVTYEYLFERHSRTN